MKKKIRAAAGFLAILLAFSLLQMPMVSKAETKSGDITIQYPIDNVEFRLYKIGQSDQKGGYVLEEPYASYQIDVTSKDAAATLEGYVERDAITPTDSGVTGADGRVSFGNLKMGVYLILGEVVTVNNVIYTPSPILAELPQNDNGKPNWQVVIDGKYDELPITEITALKIWKDDEYKDRPESITAQLLCNGEAVDEVKLSKENDWKYTWEELDAAYKWSVVEKEVPENYTVSIQRNGTVVGITNTRTSNTPPPPSIPQTGQLWWPIPILAFLGLIFLLLGFYRRSRNEN